MGPHNILGTDPASVRDAHLDRRLVRRVWGFARPYRLMLVAFLVTIVLEALVGIVPPLLIKRIIDTAIPQQDNGMVTTLALCHGGDRARRRVAVARRAVVVGADR